MITVETRVIDNKVVNDVCINGLKILVFDINNEFCKYYNSIYEYCSNVTKIEFDYHMKCGYTQYTIKIIGVDLI